MTLTEFKLEINKLASKKIPFIFVMDFDKQNPFVCTLENAEKEKVFYQINNKGNFKNSKSNKIDFKAEKISKKEFNNSFKVVRNGLEKGDSYLTNLTFSTPIKFNKKTNLLNVLKETKAKYKLCFKEQFISFSPEIFIKINENKIATFPMKGTINANILNAKEKVLTNKKEIQEHNTIVDLLRNDLSMVSTNVQIEKFRYIDKLTTNKGNILQVSSEITGDLPKNWKENLGDILLKLLPAGSISGAPKQKTLEIIHKAEKHKRGYYSGIFGVFDGENLDTSVLIRFIEKIDSNYFYKSGGGITYLSNNEEEYNEVNQKIYLPK